jgi:hypothetical protein
MNKKRVSSNRDFFCFYIVVSVFVTLSGVEEFLIYFGRFLSGRAVHYIPEEKSGDAVPITNANLVFKT